MSVNRIKANSVEFEGDYVHIIRDPMRSLWFGAGVIIATIFIFNPALPNQDIPIEYLAVTYLIIISTCGALCAIIAGEKEEYLVPRTDVLAIKKYPARRRVTVVLDDERVKYSLTKLIPLD